MSESIEWIRKATIRYYRQMVTIILSCYLFFYCVICFMIFLTMIAYTQSMMGFRKLSDKLNSQRNNETGK